MCITDQWQSAIDVRRYVLNKYMCLADAEKRQLVSLRLFARAHVCTPPGDRKQVIYDVGRVTRIRFLVLQRKVESMHKLETLLQRREAASKAAFFEGLRNGA